MLYIFFMLITKYYSPNFDIKTRCSKSI